MPHPALRHGVAGYVGYRTVARAPVRRRLFPRGVVTILFDWESPARRPPGGGPVRRGLVVPVSGLHDRVVEFDQWGRHGGVAVGLTPPAAHALLGIGLAELSNVRADLGDLLPGTVVASIAEQLAETSGWSGRFALVDEFLLTALGSRLPEGDTVVRSWSRLADTRGRLPIAALAAESGITTRQLEQRFLRQVGLSPKLAARILRFEHAVTWLVRDATVPMARIAHECGYSDQAHFTRDVRSLARTTPTGLRAILRTRVGNTLSSGTGPGQSGLAS
ncbi:AraC family transcriptional regulator [Amycolatopsis australiensis]|uniref:AraC family transcriptional regulator n=1 Tax=Amycolatopsis australiensis TaxID=546364 RepID=UPI0015A6673E|nr:helix-turn-helix domain-containing protein [Amycolatopsis australiensis]